MSRNKFTRPPPCWESAESQANVNIYFLVAVLPAPTESGAAKRPPFDDSRAASYPTRLAVATCCLPGFKTLSSFAAHRPPPVGPPPSLPLRPLLNQEGGFAGPNPGNDLLQSPSSMCMRVERAQWLL